MLDVPAVRADVNSVAMPPSCAEPLPIVIVPSLKVMVPVGVLPPDTGVTVAVKVTGVPTASDGFGELPSAVCVGLCGSPNAARWLAWSVAYTAPFATITLSQCVLPPRAALHSRLPETGSSARTELPPMENTMLLAMTGNVPLWPLCHCGTSDGLPLPSKFSRKADAPLPFTTKIHVLLSAGFTHTAG